MADNDKKRSVPIREGYQPKPLKPEETGYQPQGGARIDPKTIKPPKGGSAIQRPASSEKKDK